MTLQLETFAIRNKIVQLFRGGSGTPILYLHGVAADIHSLPLNSGFTAFHEALTTSFRVYAPALPGYAESEGFEELETIEDAVFFCRDVLDTLQLDTVHLIGTSLGGWVATEFAIRYAHRLQKLVLINPLGISVPQARIGNFFYTVTPKAEGGQQEVRELLFHDQHSELALGAFPDQMSPEMTILFYKAQMVAARLGWKPPYLHNPRLKERLFRVARPTLLVWAEHDRLAPIGLTDVYTQGLPNVAVARIPAAGHSVLLERPQEVATLVTQFLQG